MRKSTLLLSSGAVGLVFGASAQATIVFSDNFDSYADQAAFQTVWAPIGSTLDTTKQSAQLSTAQASSPTKSVFVPVSTTATSTSTEYRNRATFAETSTLMTSGNLDSTHQVVFSFDYYDSTGSGNPQRNFANLHDTTAPGSTNQLVSMGLNNNQASGVSGGNYYMARILGYAHPAVDPEGGANEDANGTTSGAYFKLNDYAVGLRSQGWHNLKVIISLNANGNGTDYAFYVDNVLAETVVNVGAAGTARSYDNITLGSGLTNGNVSAYFDNVSLEVVPEPATLALLSLGGLVLRRRRVAA